MPISRSWHSVFWFAAVLAAQSQVGPDEVIVHGGPYAPLNGGVIRTQVDLVEVPVVVRNGKGAAVPGLTRDNFEVQDSGKKREIAAFSVETFTRSGMAKSTEAAPAAAPSPVAPAPKAIPLKRVIALVLDDLNTDFADLRRGKSAAQKFVAESLAPGDLVGVFTTALSPPVTFTTDAQKLQKTIEAVQPHPMYADDSMQCPRIRAYDAYLIVNHLDNEVMAAKVAELRACQPGIRDPERIVTGMAQTTWESARRVTENTLRSISGIVAAMSKLPGQRIVLLTSGGFLSGDTEEQMQELSIQALHSGVVINSMDLRGLYTVIPGGDASEMRPVGRVPRGAQITEAKMAGRTASASEDGLAVLAFSTGGQFAHNSNDLAGGLQRIGAVPEVLYVLGFAPTDVVRDGKYHPLKVRLTGGAHGSVQARMGYTAPSKEVPAEQVHQRDFDRLMLGSDTPSDVAIKITTGPGLADDGPACGIKTWIDIGQLDFETKEDRRTQKVTITAALLDAAGSFVAGRQGEAQLALKQTTFDRMATGGLTLSLSVPAEPGSYNLRVLVQEGLKGKTTAVSRSVEVH
jgi:VWFA-related protein